MTIWNKQSEAPSKPVLPKTTYHQSELYRFKLQVEDEIKASPLCELTKQFYEQWAKPFERVAKEPKIPP